LSGVGFAQAQEYPTRPVRVVVGYPGGGGADFFARAVTQKLSEALGQPFIVENRPGAGSNIGAEVVARSAPDGYTLLVMNIAFAANPSLYAKLPFDPLKDFTPISQVASLMNLLVVHPSVPVTSVKELIALAKSNPGKMNYASAGNGSSTHLAGELFKSMAGVQIVHIPFKGAPPAITAVLSGEVGMMFAAIPTALSQSKAGRLRALAVGAARRSSAAPGIPTIAEAGVPGFDVSSWVGMAAPAGTPRPIILKLNQEIVKVTRLPDVQEQLSREGAESISSTPEQFAALVRSEMAKWSKVVKQAGIRAD
jgi:tripartite-type tricarboxylate transporter receptor subunit TctC